LEENKLITINFTQNSKKQKQNKETAKKKKEEMKPKKNLNNETSKKSKETQTRGICVYCEQPKKVAIEKEEKYLKRAGRSLHIEAEF